MICSLCRIWIPGSNGSVAEHGCKGVRALPPLFSWGGLWCYAKKVAMEPPVEVWKTKMDVPVSAELSQHLEAESLDDVPIHLQQDWMMKKAAEQLDGTVDGHVKQAGTICDLTAYSMMAVGAGIERVRALNSGSPATEGDHVERCETETDCRDAIADWADIQAPGVMQFKFKPGTGAHTFAVERLWLGHGEPMFRVYQSYQGTYRLSDSLGLTSSNDVHPGEDSFHRNKRLKTFQSMKGAIGGGKLLSRQSFDELVAQPMSRTLSTGMSSGEYANLTGGHSQQNQTCKRVLLLCCDRIDPKSFASNYESLRGCRDMAARWVELDV